MLYLNICISACIDSIRVLHRTVLPAMNFVPYDALLMGAYVGTTTLRESPLVEQVLDGDTTPRKGVLFLESKSSTSRETCTQVVGLPDQIYTDAFQRSLFATLTTSVSAQVSLLNPNTTELIFPVVDCTCSSITYRDLSAVRFFYLIRKKDTPDDVYLVTVALSVQEYKIVARDENGAAGVSTIAIIRDLRASSVTHYFALALGYPFLPAVFEAYELEQVTPESYWRLQRVPLHSSDVPKQVQTACRTGFYISGETEQSNIKNTIWRLPQDPLEVIKYWQWEGRPVLRDSWAWLHCLHVLLAFDVFVNLVVLLVVIHHNLRKGHVWIGDAFVAVSSTLWTRSSLVLVSWYMNEFWAVMEFCIFNGNVISDTQSFFVLPSIMRADLLALYFCVIGVIGTALKERIDPVLTMGLFYVGFETRLEVAQWFPEITKTMTAYVTADYNLSMYVDPSLASISPLRLWSTHELTNLDVSFILASIFPVFSTFVLVVVYVALRKLYRIVFPPKLIVQRVTGYSEHEDRLFHLKGTLTLFEIATGAALQNRYGIIADYDNCIYIKGVKFASADGIYSSGYVIANGKFLVQTDDLVSILLMKLLRTRFRNVYAYEVEGNTVKPQARLVYPETISYHDLLQLNVDILS
uniref:Uncharacterized protein n=1 Tax=Globisporangium ultimum (strain ATCC 200006 / CBS 805.95 / DAOM BR144) TaxID=431595 RepID=K3WZY6_GLOUD